MPNHRIYLASSWRNRYHADLLQKLRQQGYQVYDFKNPVEGNSGFAWRDVDPEWQTWSPDQLREKLAHPLAVMGFDLDMGALQEAEIVVLCLPSGRSSHIEAGYHKGRGRPVVVYAPEPVEPELMYRLFDAIVTTESELFNYLEYRTG